MIFRLLVKPFGSIWNLKTLCNKKSPTLLRKSYRFLYNAYQFEHGSALDYAASFSNIPSLPHGTKQIIITKDVKIGKDCVIFHQVTIESDKLPSSKNFGSPIIGDNCYIYPGVKIIGKVTIGDHVRIAPNAVVTEDIPSYSFVHQSSQRISKLDNKTPDRYYALFDTKWKYFQNNTIITETDETIIKKFKETF